MKVNTVVCCLSLILAYSCVRGSKILGIFHMPAPSHYILGSTLMRALAEKGHDVTMISSFAEKTPPKNGTYRDIVLTGFLEDMQEKFKKFNFYEISEQSTLLNMFIVNGLGKESCENTLKHPNVRKLIESNEKFDVVIVEQFGNEAMKALAPHFGAPLIVFSTVPSNSWINALVGNPAPPSYVAELQLSYSSHMTFFQRTTNTFFQQLQQVFNNIVVYPQQSEIAKRYIPNAPELADVIYNASIVLLNSHPSISQPVPHVPAMIEIGGFHVKPPKALPKDLQAFLDGAPEGVIYFSMGSNLKSSLMPLEKRDAFLKAFAKLKQKVLWKWEEDSLPGQPANLKLGKWLPQQDILAHPNVRLFITHGGFLSTTETVYHGVPVLAIPIFGDQKMNAATAVANGYGLSLAFNEVSEATLTASIRELLSNPKYTNTAKARSRALLDQETKPLDRAVFWVEHVIRNKGENFFRVAALDLKWYQYYLLDVIVLFGSVLLAITFVIYMATKKLWRALTGAHQTKKVKRH